MKVYNIGDWVTITGNSCYHGIPIGSKIQIEDCTTYMNPNRPVYKWRGWSFNNNDIRKADIPKLVKIL